MSLPVIYTRYDGGAVDSKFVHAAVPNIQNILEEFESAFEQANGHLDILIKDDIGNISLVIECGNQGLKERMYKKLGLYRL